MNQETFHERLKTIMDSYVDLVYEWTQKFPRHEMYGVTSQLRRSALSVVLNYIEGSARRREKVYKNFLEISYGSLKESRYLLEFSERQKYISKEESLRLVAQADEIGAMLWGIIRKM